MMTLSNDLATPPLMTSNQTAHARAAKDGKINAARVMRAALGELLSQGAVGEVSALAVGCAVLLTRHATQKVDFASEGSRINERTAQSVLAMKGLSGQDAELVLEALAMTGLISRREGLIEIPELDAALESESSSLANRRAGWVKRAAASPATSSTKPPSNQLTAALAPQPAEPPTASTAKAEAVNANGTTAPKAVRRVIDGVEYRRINARESVVTDPAQDPVQVRVVCKGEAIAELTKSYVAHLQEAFKSIDVEQELRHCAAWAEANPGKRKTFTGVRRFVTTWLTNATQSAHMRGAVTRATAQRNGFGQGGNYEVETRVASTAQGSLLDSAEDDGLGDLLAPAHEQKTPEEAPHGAASMDHSAEGKTRLSLVPTGYRTADANVEKAAAVEPAAPPTRRLTILERVRAGRGGSNVAVR